MADDDDDDDGFFLFGLVTVANPDPLPVGEVFRSKAELERGNLTWHCFKVTSLSGVLPLAAAAVAIIKQSQTWLRSKRELKDFCYTIYCKYIINTFIYGLQYRPDRVDLRLSVEGDEVRRSVLPPLGITWWPSLTTLDSEGDLPKHDPVGELAVVRVWYILTSFYVEYALVNSLKDPHCIVCIPDLLILYKNQHCDNLVKQNNQNLLSEKLNLTNEHRRKTIMKLIPNDVNM